MVTLVPLVGIVLLFWLFIIRPQTRRQRELRSMQTSLSVGDEVMLTSGVYGSVRALEADHALIEIAQGVVIKVALGAVGNKIEQHEDEDASTDDDQPGVADNGTPGAVADGPEEN